MLDQVPEYTALRDAPSRASARTMVRLDGAPLSGALENGELHDVCQGGPLDNK